MEWSSTAVTRASGPNDATKQRVQAVDALRGLALVGMLLVHFQYYVNDSSLWSQRINSAVDFLAVDRFYPLFAVLFGTGFTLQMMRWGERPGFVAMYLRRLTALMAFAVLLIGLTGYRVLESYAFWALPLLAIRRWSNRTLVIVILCCAFAHPLVEFATWQWEKRNVSLEESNARVKAELRYWPAATQEGDRLRDEGKFRELVEFRLRKTFGQYLHWQYFVPGDPFLLFLVGMLAVRLQVFQDPSRYRKLLIAIIVVGSFAGIMSAIVGNVLHFDSLPSARLALAARRLTYAIFDERLQGMAYAAVILLWMAQSSLGQRVGRYLSYPGRLSLTNYVVQVSILEIFFATSHPIIPLNCRGALVGVVVVFLLQIAFSRWWILRYRFGPLEWLWRSMTFARWERLRREMSEGVVA
jgi:uncharacterized protein